MNLKAAVDQNTAFDRVTRIGMAICFLSAGIVMIAALTFDTHHQGASSSFSLSRP
jgi:hypothetical protein